jgi:hypothetical protein
MARCAIAPYPCADEGAREAFARRGFLVLRALTAANAWADCFAGPDVHPARVQARARRCLDRLCDMLSWACHMTKFRASSSRGGASATNATDAAALHRDVRTFGEVVPPLFTLVIYGYCARLRVAPGTHARLRIPWHRALALGTELVECAPGDAVLFHASLLHSGVFADNAGDRRVVQCFDIFPDARAAAEWCPRLLHVTAARSGEARSDGISRLVRRPAAGPLLTALFALHAAGGYGRVRLPPGSGIISGEADRSRVAREEYWRWGPANRYTLDPTSPWGRVDALPDWNCLVRAQVYGARAVGRNLAAPLTALGAALIVVLVGVIIAVRRLAAPAPRERILLGKNHSQAARRLDWAA